MEKNDGLLQVISDIGLNEYETKAYISILEHGTIVAKEISTETGIPYAKVYQTLDSLIELGLITTDGGRPKKFTINNPEISIRQILTSMKQNWLLTHEKRERNFKDVIPYLKKTFIDAIQNSTPSKSIVSIFGLDAIQKELERLVDISDDIILTSSDKTIINLVNSIVNNRSLILRTSLNDYNDQNVKLISEQGIVSTLLFYKSALISIIPVRGGDYRGVINSIPEIIEDYFYEIRRNE